jgi:hypothetical protein
VTRSKAPQADEVEVSLLGPGTGEAVVLHLGDNDWVVVDSCIHRDTRENAVVEYLDLLGVEPGDVRVLIASHAHDDHITDFATLVETYPDALVACSMATTSEEFFALLEQDVHFLELRHSVYKEFNRIFDLMRERRNGSRGYTYTWAIETRELWRRPGTSAVPAASVRALSPSDVAVTRSKEAFASLAAAAGETPTIPQHDPNELAVAAWIEVGSRRILLGSDLKKGPAGCGWGRVVTAALTNGERASVYKVAHHGDPRADHPGVWADLLEPKPTAIVAPYRPSHRPRAEDLLRLCNRTDETYVTAHPGFRLTKGVTRSAAASLSDLAFDVRETDRHAGHVRLRTRWDALSPWNVELFPPARRACA